MARGYCLGAVDYIQAPVMPEVLRSKVSVFVDLYQKNAQVRRQAETLRRRATQLQKLAAASMAINSAVAIDQMLQTVTSTLATVIGSQLASPSSGPIPPPANRMAAFAQRSVSQTNTPIGAIAMETWKPQHPPSSPKPHPPRD